MKTHAAEPLPFRRATQAIAITLLLAGCGASSAHGALPSTDPTPPSTASGRSQPSRSESPRAVTDHIVSITDDHEYRVATLSVTVEGPADVQISYCGSPSPVDAWAVDGTGMRLSSGRMYAQFCASPRSESIAAGASKTYAATARWLAASGPVTLHGRVAVSGATAAENLPVLAVR